MTIQKKSCRASEACPTGEVLLATGATIAMRLWQDEEPQTKSPHSSPCETIGNVLEGLTELTVSGKTTDLAPGDSYLVPAHASHVYRSIYTF